MTSIVVNLVDLEQYLQEPQKYQTREKHSEGNANDITDHHNFKCEHARPSIFHVKHQTQNGLGKLRLYI
jgi:hypothetical protein